MARRRKTAAPRKLKRNPVARSLRSPLFSVKVVERPDRPRRKPKHPKRLDEEEAADE
jgi:hypothetical protein